MAENTFQKSTITSEAAQRLIAAAEAKAREMNIPMSIAVVDSDGTLKAFSRMDGAALLSVQRPATAARHHQDGSADHLRRRLSHQDGGRDYRGYRREWGTLHA